MAQDVAVTAVHAIWPTLAVDGEADERVGGLITGMLVSHRLGAPALLQLELIATFPDDLGHVRFVVPERLRLGATIAVEMGEASSTMFSGHITAIEQEWSDQSPTVRVTALDRLHQLRYGQRTRAFGNLPVSDIVAQLADNHGLQIEVSATELQITVPLVQL